MIYDVIGIIWEFLEILDQEGLSFDPFRTEAPKVSSLDKLLENQTENLILNEKVGKIPYLSRNYHY